MQIVTKQRCYERLYLLRPRKAEVKSWYYILVPYDKLPIVLEFERGIKLSAKNYYRFIECRDDYGVIKQVSGPGTDPPPEIVQWVYDNYEPVAVDDTTPLTYSTDDIRLCSIQQSSTLESIGVVIGYHKHERFHYVKPKDNFQNTLAFRAGIRLYDRIIEVNGTNIENDIDGKMIKQMANDAQLIQLLLCSPATLEHYRTENKQLHSNLETVKLMKPVRNSPRNDDFLRNDSQTDNEEVEYCAIRWKDGTGIRIVPISSTQIPAQQIHLYDRCIVEHNGQRRKAQIIFKGSKANCELLLPDTDANNHAEVRRPIPKFVKHSDERRVARSASTSCIQTNQASQQEPSKASVKQDDKREVDRKDRIIIQLVQMLMNATNDDNENTHNAGCDGCHSLRISSDRYKCLQCKNYDLCGDCFEKRKETKEHNSGHAFAHFKVPMELFGEQITNANEEVTLSKFKKRFAGVKHTNVTCDGCETTPITGIRFKCDTCHDYDLCLTCMENQRVTKEHDTEHSLIVASKDRFNQIDIDDIEMGDELGRGAFGAVHKAKWISKNRQVACKILLVPPDKEHLEQSFLRELEVYTEVSGAYILKLYGFAIQNDTTNNIRKCLLIMEFMSRGSLTNVLKQEKKLSLRRKLDMACHIASGMRKLHARHMIHRDIRPDNILVNENYIAKIGDMGIARVMDETNHLTLIGCGHYMPPEFCTGKYDQSLDVFTFGLTLNHLFTEKQHQSIQVLVITKVKLAEQSPVFSDLIARCIHNHPSQRPSAIEIETTLQAYKRAFDKLVLSEHLEYMQMSTEGKNRVFLKFYEAVHPKIKAALENRFPPPPSLPTAASSDGNGGANIFQALSLLINQIAEQPDED